MELVQKLLEYKRFKDTAMLLEHQQQEHQSRFPRVPAKLEGEADEPPPVDLEEVQIWDLLDAFSRLMKEVGVRKPRFHEVTYDDTPIDLHAADIEDRLKREGQADARAADRWPAVAERDDRRVPGVARTDPREKDPRPAKRSCWAKWISRSRPRNIAGSTRLRRCTWRTRSRIAGRPTPTRLHEPGPPDTAATDTVDAAMPSRMRPPQPRRFPLTGWIGLSIILLCEAMLFADVVISNRGAVETESAVSVILAESPKHAFRTGRPADRDQHDRAGLGRLPPAA